MAKAKQEEPEPPMVEQLRRAIRASGQTLDAIGRASKVDRGRISRFLRGERTITLDAAGRICESLGITLDIPEPLQQAPAEQLPDESESELTKKSTPKKKPKK